MRLQLGIALLPSAATTSFVGLACSPRCEAPADGLARPCAVDLASSAVACSPGSGLENSFMRSNPSLTTAPTLHGRHHWPDHSPPHIHSRSLGRDLRSTALLLPCALKHGASGGRCQLCLCRTTRSCLIHRALPFAHSSATSGDHTAKRLHHYERFESSRVDR